METCQSPRKVMVVAWRVGNACLPAYASRFSRRDFTLPQLFACLVLRQFYNLSYRKTEALLRDSPGWRRAIGLKKTPDHNTLCDAFDGVVQSGHLDKMLDLLADAFEKAGLLQLDRAPLAIDSSCFESRHVSRHFERRRRDGKSEQAVKSERSTTVKKLPKLAIAVAASCHLILAAWTTTGAGADHPHFESVLFDAWRRSPVVTVVADAGYDSEDAHRLARDDMSVASIIPARAGRPTSKPPPTHYRRLMHDGFADGSLNKEYGQRWQSETVNSMLKRNTGSALRARTPERRECELLLKVVTHNLAL
ncbi:MAG: transposase [Terriglobia bacterium]